MWLFESVYFQCPLLAIFLFHLSWGQDWNHCEVERILVKMKLIFVFAPLMLHFVFCFCFCLSNFQWKLLVHFKLSPQTQVDLSLLSAWFAYWLGQVYQTWLSDILHQLMLLLLHLLHLDPTSFHHQKGSQMLNLKSKNQPKACDSSIFGSLEARGGVRIRKLLCAPLDPSSTEVR